LNWPDEDVLTLLSAAFRVRLKHFGRKVKMNFLVNIQSGLCPEDCHYCSQSKISKADIEKYRLMSPEEVSAAAEKAVALKASRLCMVASMRGPSDRDIESVAAAVREVKEKYPQLELCACLGLLKDGQAAALGEAGVDAYNHNLNTSESHYGKICSTHTYQDRVDTVEKSRCEGLSACSGALFGMGEKEDDVLDVAYRLREMGVDSIPVNFLIPIKGTPLVGREDLTPVKCLKILCLFRFLCPDKELRIAGGRELQLRSLQPLGLYAANSLFIGDYLTTEGQAPSHDVQMIRDMGFEILGEDAEPAPAPALADQVTFTSRQARLSK
jgi:biotin synthase